MSQTTVPYNHRAVEQKWRKVWEDKPINVNDGKKAEILLSGYVSISIRKWSSCRSLERLCYI